MEKELKNKIDPTRIPSHIAIIMDGNGRWAKQRGAFRVFGHRNAITSVRDTTEICAELGVQYLTLYAFSTENWNRPKEEVNALMELLISTINKEVPELNKNNIRLTAIGNTEQLPERCQKELRDAMEKTANNTRMTLILALSYSGRWEITEAVKNITADVQKGIISSESITEQTISQYLSTAGVPDPELMIRTSGEMRISNFLLWQLAYAELYITPVLWPDFNKEELLKAILDFQGRERRFGMISEQVNPR